jgi:transposase
MYGVDLYGLVRRMVMRDGLSHREAARRFGIDRGTVAKMVKHPVPPGYPRTIPVRRPKLADHVGFIEQVLDADETAPAKQRHTARRIFERLRDERGFDGSYSTVRDYVRSRRQVRKEVFVPLAHPPGHAQADFGEAVVVLGGVEQKVRFFVMVAIERHWSERQWRRRRATRSS